MQVVSAASVARACKTWLSVNVPATRVAAWAVSGGQSSGRDPAVGRHRLSENRRAPVVGRERPHAAAIFPRESGGKGRGPAPCRPPQGRSERAGRRGGGGAVRGSAARGEATCWASASTASGGSACVPLGAGLRRSPPPPPPPVGPDPKASVSQARARWPRCPAVCRRWLRDGPGTKCRWVPAGGHMRWDGPACRPSDPSDQAWQWGAKAGRGGGGRRQRGGRGGGCGCTNVDGRAEAGDGCGSWHDGVGRGGMSCHIGGRQKSGERGPKVEEGPSTPQACNAPPPRRHVEARAGWGS